MALVSAFWLGGITPKGENHLINNYLIDVGTVKGDCVHISGGWGPFGKSKIVKNIFFNHEGNQNFYYRFKPEDLGELNQCQIDHNVYFSGAATAEKQFLRELRKHGHDENSFYSDPLFVDWKHAEFRLGANSPAHKLGIKPIDLSSVGLTKDFPERLKQ